MSTENNKALLYRWISSRNANNLEAGVALWADDWQGRMTAVFNSVTEAFPDVRITPKEMLAEGDKVALWWLFTATHSGTFQGIPATGKAVTWTGIDIYTFADERLAGLVRAADNLNLLQQLGANTSVFFPFTPA